MVTYEYAIQQAQRFQRTAQAHMDKAVSGHNSDGFANVCAHIAEQAAVDMVYWYRVASRISRGHTFHMAEVIVWAVQS